MHHQSTPFTSFKWMLLSCLLNLLAPILHLTVFVILEWWAQNMKSGCFQPLVMFPNSFPCLPADNLPKSPSAEFWKDWSNSHETQNVLQIISRSDHCHSRYLATHTSLFFKPRVSHNVYSLSVLVWKLHLLHLYNRAELNGKFHYSFVILYQMHS